MLQQTLGGRRYSPIRAARQRSPRVDMTPDLIDDRAVAVGLKRQRALGSRSPAPRRRHRNDKLRRPAAFDRRKNVVVLNDEAHHCYRQRALSEEERLDREAQAEARENNVAARLWISGIEALKRKVGLRAVYDLSATPFFLRGSGYREGTLFPWVVSDSV